ncbi:MAG: type IV toxin-antitoxin system AbiEi family antitoxin domain-containing protein [Trebonia sp.]
MPAELPPKARELLAGQGHVITRSQAIALGLGVETIRNRVRCGDWQQLQVGVYAGFTGAPGRDAQVWAALLRAGPGAVLSHWTAAERHGLVDKPCAATHLTVPIDRRPARWATIPGVVIHRSRRLDQAIHPAMSPPCTRVEYTVLDLIEASTTFEEAYDWICRAIGRRRTTSTRIREAMATRPRMRWRQDLVLALGDDHGALSVLEHRYVRGVERPHGLPVASRQARVWQGSGNRYLDNLYAEYHACVEIDGTAAHPADEQWRDKDRDRWNAVHQKVDTIRIGMLGLRTPDAQCATASDVATWLSGRGSTTGHPCTRPGCPVPLRAQ